jgi:long-chain fatty acid transport protein
MRRRASRWLPILACSALGVAVAAPVFGAGFGIFEHGSRAMGMGGAFTAQADDPSAMFYNVAGLGFQNERDFMVGFTWIRGTQAEFDGANPFPGVGITEEQKTLSEFPPHAYWVEPLGDRWTFGLGLNSPFGLVVDWDNPATFSGRFVSTKSQLNTLDINPSLAVKVSDDFSVGFGAIGRFASVELNQFIPAQNPFTQTVTNVGFLELKSDLTDSEGFGFNLGLLYKPDGFFSWGLSYRSEVSVDFSGDGSLSQIPTGNAQFDAAVANALPFGAALPVETGIDFPQMASMGLGFRLADGVMLETDINWTGWSSFDSLVVDFVNDQLPDAVRPQEWNDVFNYRVGVSFDTRAGNQVRFGALYDETPQVEEAVSPLLPDNNRTGLSIGYGFNGPKLTWDFALLYLHLEKRTRDQSFPGESDFFGTYDNEAILLGFSLGF